MDDDVVPVFEDKYDQILKRARVLKASGTTLPISRLTKRYKASVPQVRQLLEEHDLMDAVTTDGTKGF